MNQTPLTTEELVLAYVCIFEGVPQELSAYSIGWNLGIGESTVRRCFDKLKQKLMIQKFDGMKARPTGHGRRTYSKFAGKEGWRAQAH